MTTTPVGAHLDWLRRRGLSERTITERSYVLQALENLIGKPLLAATPHDLAAWRATQDGHAPQSVCTRIMHVAGFYKFALDEGWITADPSRRLPRPRIPRHLPRPIATAVLFAVLAIAPPRVRLMLVLMAYAGLRCCEVAGLTSGDVRLGPPRPVLLIDGKGGHQRVVPLCDFAVRELAAFGLPRRLDDPVIPRGDGQSGPNTAHNISKVVNEFLHGEGIAETAHSLRSWYATECNEADPSAVLALADAMGHVDLKTIRRYARVSGRAGAAMVAGLPVPPRLRSA